MATTYQVMNILALHGGEQTVTLSQVYTIRREAIAYFSRTLQRLTGKDHRFYELRLQEGCVVEAAPLTERDLVEKVPRPRVSGGRKKGKQPAGDQSAVTEEAS